MSMRKPMNILLCWLAALVAAGSGETLLAQGPPGAVPGPPSNIVNEVGLDQKLNQQIPLDLRFRDEGGNEVALGSYFIGGKPVVLALVYYDCPMLCTQILNGMVKSFAELSYKIGNEFEVVSVSINPRETPKLAAAKKEIYLGQYPDKEAGNRGWHFLTTPDDRSIRRLADAVGFRYVYDTSRNQYAHASGIMVVSPSGKLSRYFYGIEYSSRDLRFALSEASEGKISGAVDKILLLCYQYDPMTGKYGLVVANLLRIGGVLTIVLVGGFILLEIRRDKRRKAAAAAAAGAGKAG